MAKTEITNRRICNYVGDGKLDNVLAMRAKMLGIDKSTLYRQILDEYFEANPMKSHEEAVYNG